MQRPSPSPEAPVNYHYTWIGDLTSEIDIPRYDDPLKEEGQLAFRRGLLARLHERHGLLADGDILIVDLCGIRETWQKASSVPISSYFIEANYTSLFGRFAVVLFNVPEAARAVFEQAIELAVEQFDQLREFRRAALLVYDTGEVALYCGSSLAQEHLATIADSGELELSYVVKDLDDVRKTQLLKFLRENDHLFSVSRTNIRLRPWPAEVRAAVWQCGNEWITDKLDNGFEDGGIHLRKADGYFRLPASGCYSRDFFHFRTLLADYEANARICWMLAMTLHAIGKRAKVSIDWIIAVTRPSMELAESVAVLFEALYGSRPRVLVAGTVEELAERATATDTSGHAVLISNVVSSGSTAHRVLSAIPTVDWTAILTCLDTRPDAGVNVVGIETVYGIVNRLTPDVEDVNVYTLAVRDIDKLKSDLMESENITTIDEVNICPVDSLDSGETSEHEFWDLSDETSALHVGHFEEPGYHHYLYYVDPAQMLRTPLSRSTATVLSSIISRSVSELGGYDPNKIFVVHPPGSLSHGAVVAMEIQRATGALYRQALYRDMFTGHLRFSSFAQHGLPMEGGVIVLVDDGSNTGETLIGMLDMAARRKPLAIRAYVALSRLPVHKAHLLTKIRKLDGCEDVQVHLALALAIPVYTARTCPVCDLAVRLVKVSALVPLLSAPIKDMVTRVAERTAGTKGYEDFLRLPHSAVRASRIRESIERLDFHEPSLRFLKTVVAEIVDDPKGEAALIDLAFVMCNEPGLLHASVFLSALKPLLSACFESVAVCPPDAVLPISAVAFLLPLSLSNSNVT